MDRVCFLFIFILFRTFLMFLGHGVFFLLTTRISFSQTEGTHITTRSRTCLFPRDESSTEVAGAYDKPRCTACWCCRTQWFEHERTHIPNKQTNKHKDFAMDQPVSYVDVVQYLPFTPLPFNQRLSRRSRSLPPAVLMQMYIWSASSNKGVFR